MTTVRQLSRKSVTREYDSRGYAKPLRIPPAVKAHQWAPTKATLPANISPPPKPKSKHQRRRKKA